MAAINWPSNPQNGDTHTSGGRTWVWSDAKNAWRLHRIASGSESGNDLGPFYFDDTLSADGSWSNPENWWCDAQCTVPAGTSPSEGALVFFKTTILNLEGQRRVYEASFGYGAALDDSTPGNALYADMPVHFAANSGILNGTVYADCYFDGLGSGVGEGGSVSGDAYFLGTGTSNAGSISGVGYFRALTDNTGTVGGGAKLLGELYAGLPGSMTPGNMLRVSSSGGLEERTPGEVRTDIGAGGGSGNRFGVGEFMAGAMIDFTYYPSTGSSLVFGYYAWVSGLYDLVVINPSCTAGMGAGQCSLANLDGLVTCQVLDDSSRHMGFFSISNCPALVTLDITSNALTSPAFGYIDGVEYRGVIVLSGNLGSLNWVECNSRGLVDFDISGLTAIAASPTLFLDDNAIPMAKLEQMVNKLAALNVAGPGLLVTGGRSVRSYICGDALAIFTANSFGHDLIPI